MSKGIDFLGDSLDRLRDFPDKVKQTAGYELSRVQEGKEPRNYRPMPSVGLGVVEIKIKADNGEFRVLYVAKREDIVYVLHCFQKKAQKTAKTDIDLARQRYKDIT
ncbi:type II toxin-antitoxin system RelE/ParE family toxin [Halomonas cupida]|uniref:type II toxin-antitoxin system RelE/ParE family toxin n=1 Tax=Halomonas cupida TaxID=44933 RepID=UPI0039B660C6